VDNKSTSSPATSTSTLDAWLLKSQQEQPWNLIAAVPCQTGPEKVEMKPLRPLGEQKGPSVPSNGPMNTQFVTSCRSREAGGLEAERSGEGAGITGTFST
jgi:hypothetical protein